MYSRCSVANLTRRVGTRLVVHLVVVLQQLLLVNVLVAALVLHKLSGLREERAVVVARAEVLCKTSELTKVESAVSLLLLLLLVVTIVIVIVIVVVIVVVAILIVATLIVEEALGNVSELVDVESGHFGDVSKTCELS